MEATTIAHEERGDKVEATTTESPYKTYEEAAQYCRCERTTIYRAVKAGRSTATNLCAGWILGTVGKKAAPPDRRPISVKDDKEVTM